MQHSSLAACKSSPALLRCLLKTSMEAGAGRQWHSLGENPPGQLAKPGPRASRRERGFCHSRMAQRMLCTTRIGWHHLPWLNVGSYSTCVDAARCHSRVHAAPTPGWLASTIPTAVPERSPQLAAESSRCRAFISVSPGELHVTSLPRRERDVLRRHDRHTSPHRTGDARDGKTSVFFFLFAPFSFPPLPSSFTPKRFHLAARNCWHTWQPGLRHWRGNNGPAVTPLSQQAVSPLLPPGIPTHCH